MKQVRIHACFVDKDDIDDGDCCFVVDGLHVIYLSIAPGTFCAAEDDLTFEPILKQGTQKGKAIVPRTENSTGRFIDRLEIWIGSAYSFLRPLYHQSHRIPSSLAT
jgi:hypothetical protein